MNSYFSKLWNIVISLWVVYVAVLYLRDLESIENINNLLIVLSGVLVTASVGIGAIAYIFLNDYGKSKVLDMVVVLIFLSFSSAIVGHLDGKLELKKFQFILNVFFLTTTCSFVLGYFKGKMLEIKVQSNKVNNKVRNNKPIR
ncbi:MAG: hypothetical protein RR440_00450 [Erysipelotrichaceae bacterium]